MALYYVKNEWAQDFLELVIANHCSALYVYKTATGCESDSLWFPRLQSLLLMLRVSDL